ncbi:unnamed protein product [Medioppia subpectinata]|uniref:Uncharacterized protein n=1 Tax=Medioppia subpectinata TaxID=1979941 RepID=A0A7R9KYF7_9ACAR|nr:unnamed protein product [Medioppia subpectinata]CAG2111103.1 unnamed protein product [Medioppia subpectinata]
MSYGKFVCSATSELGRTVTRRTKHCTSNRRLDGQTVIITGANTGIGKETAYQLSLRGAKVIMSCRSIARGEEAMNDIKGRNSGADLTLFELDLASLKSVREFAQQVSQNTDCVDILVNNAGVMNTPEWSTADGFEMQFGTNHLGHFLLTMLLLPLLQNSPKARVVNVSSIGHMAGKIHLDNINLRNGAYSPFKSYAQSKLANVLFAREMAKRLGPSTTVNTYSLHPGAVHTELARHSGGGQLGDKIMGSMFLTPELGAQTSLHCILDEGLDGESGFYYSNCQRVDNMVPAAVDDKMSQALWELSVKLVNLEPHLDLPATKAS